MRVFAFFAAFVLAVGVAHAEPGAYQAPAVGTTYEYQMDGHPISLKVLAASGLTTTWLTSGSGIRPQYAGLQYLKTRSGSPITIESPEALDRFWPLAVGKEANYAIDFDSYVSRNALHVAGIEKVMVPAGTFDAFVIDWDEDGIGNYHYHGHYRIWYVPAVGQVKWTVQGDRVSTVVLTAIKAPELTSKP